MRRREHGDQNKPSRDREGVEIQGMTAQGDRFLTGAARITHRITLDRALRRVVGLSPASAGETPAATKREDAGCYKARDAGRYRAIGAQ